MSPLFCKTDVPFELIAGHMHGHAEKLHLEKDSRRLLVGGMAARKILLATPLLKWYIQSLGIRKIMYFIFGHIILLISSTQEFIP